MRSPDLSSPARDFALTQTEDTGVRLRDAGFRVKLRDIYHDMLAAQSIERLPQRVISGAARAA